MFPSTIVIKRKSQQSERLQVPGVIDPVGGYLQYDNAYVWVVDQETGQLVLLSALPNVLQCESCFPKPCLSQS